MDIESMIEKINTLHGKEVAAKSDIISDPMTLMVEHKALFTICQFLYEDQDYLFDLLESISGVDNGPESQSMEVLYHLYSIPYNRKLGIRIRINRDQPEVESISGIWRTADWLEREVYDLFGIKFKNHPDLRRILLPADWEGHPLRKDYKTQDYYHGLKVDFDDQ